MKCPKCKNGKTNLTVSEFGKKGTEKVEINCYHCKGTGTISYTTLRKIKELDNFMKNQMCSCDNPTFGSYPQDGECDCGMHKHHVHCGNCGKITQIG